MSDSEFDRIINEAIRQARRVKCDPVPFVDTMRYWISLLEEECEAIEDSYPSEFDE